MNTTMKYFIKTSKGTFGPYDSRFLAEQAVVGCPKDPQEIPNIIQLTEDKRQVLME